MKFPLYVTPELRKVVTTFMQDNPEVINQVRVPEGAWGKCDRFSKDFLRFAMKMGVKDGKYVWLWGPPSLERATRYEAYIRKSVPHCVAVIGGVVIDWTARQFDYLAQVPEFYPSVEAMGYDVIVEDSESFGL